MTNNADLKKRNFLTQNEIESLLKAADTGPYAARNYCLTLLCFIHGLRASEICRLRISDIDLAARCVYIHRLKKGFSTTHPLLDKEIYALKRWLAIRSSWPQAASEWLFLSRKGNPLSRQQFYQIIASSGGLAGPATGDPPAHAAALLWLCVGEYGDRYPLDTGLSRASQYPPHRLVYGQQCGTLLWHLGQSP